MIDATAFARERWADRHRFCGDDVDFPDGLDEARYILATHDGHGMSCLQTFNAHAYSLGCRGAV
ncbi:hypothetical protein [Nocardia brasiliensis]|uniref:hypothetical protein n=1 Tax=Nocardia brasiliensis TaxID=37326 RepID=UPI0004A747C3|nr:hypothetical protein [Nocardia brasiliensis]